MHQRKQRVLLALFLNRARRTLCNVGTGGDPEQFQITCLHHASTRQPFASILPCPLALSPHSPHPHFPLTLVLT